MDVLKTFLYGVLAYFVLVIAMLRFLIPAVINFYARTNRITESQFTEFKSTVTSRWYKGAIELYTPKLPNRKPKSVDWFTLIGDVVYLVFPIVLISIFVYITIVQLAYSQGIGEILHSIFWVGIALVSVWWILSLGYIVRRGLKAVD